VDAQSPAERLREAIELPTPDTRAAAVRTLAVDAFVSIDLWRAAITELSARPAHASGVSREMARLWVGEETFEETSIEVYVPPAYDPARSAPLLLVLHGAGGSGSGLTGSWKVVADALGMLVIAPSEAGDNAGYAFSERERHSALSVLRWAQLAFRVDADRVCLTGASRGGHMTWDLALRHPDRFAALAPCTGAPRTELTEGRNNLRYLENVAHLPIRDLQGEGDDPRMLASLRVVFARLARWKASDAKYVSFPELGHDFELGAVDWASFLGTAVRTPVPARVVRCAARPGEGRACWVEITELGKGIEEVFQPKLDARRYNSMSDEQKVEAVADLVDEKTARLEVSMSAPGRFQANVKDVAAFRLLFTTEMLDPDGGVQVRVGSKTIKARPSADAAVLLGDYVERLDGGFLPVAELRIPVR
jgi:dienelactone hydrolase